MKLLLYCTKSKPYLIGRKNDSYYLDKGGKDRDFIHNGKIVAECDYEIEVIKYNNNNYYFEYKYAFDSLRESCLGFTELDNYLKCKDGYAIHIKNLHIFDRPMELNEFDKSHDYLKPINKAPQNMMYAYGCIQLNERFVLISIRPEWLCKILNGEKTIEIRKKVLKGMVRK